MDPVVTPSDRVQKVHVEWDALKKEQHTANTEQAQVNARHVMMEADETNLVAKMEVELRKAKKAKDEQTWAALCEGLELQERDFSTSRLRWSHRFGKLAYCLLLLFSELDFVMFIVGFNTYWSYDREGHEVVKMILVSFPTAFVISLLLNQHRVDHEVFDEQETSSDRRDCWKRMTQETNNIMALPACKMKTCHFIPIWRCKLFLRYPDCHDIEAMFRINTLSSFCLGVAQLIGVGFYVGVGGGKITLEIILNVTTVTCNWIITIVYYLTPIARIMADAVSAENFAASIQDCMEKDKQDFIAAITVASDAIAPRIANGRHRAASSCSGASQDSASIVSEDLEQDVDEVHLEEGLPTNSCLTVANLSLHNNPEEQDVVKYRKKVQAEINLLCNVLVNLDHLPLTNLIELRMRIFKKHLHLFSDL